MIIIKSTSADESALVARIENALRGEDIEIVQNDDEEFTLEQGVAVLAYNAINTRKYTGRIERNTRKLEENLRQMTKMLYPVSTFFQILVDEMDEDDKRRPKGDDAAILKQKLAEQREKTKNLVDQGLIEEEG